MDNHPDPDELPLSPAAQALAELLGRREAGEPISVDEFCAEREALGPEIRKLYACWAAVTGALDPASPAGADEPPARIGPYRVRSVLGRGGMGTVYLADREDRGEPVAVKLISSRLASERVLSRFERERRALTVLAHDNIARLLEAGMSEGRPFFAMEFVDGPPITAHCARPDTTIDDALALFAAACDGVQHAHGHGILHRDLKPSNVLVAASGPTAKVIDFGLARAGDAEVAGSFQTTRGVVLGTPEYMSPEQAAAGADLVDARSDLYALGVILYELLTGAHPFAESRGPMHLLQRIVREPPRPPSAVVAIPTDLDRLVLRALEKDPSDRHESVAAFVADLRTHVDTAS